MKSFLLILCILATSISFAEDEDSQDIQDDFSYFIPDYGTVHEPDGDTRTRIGVHIIGSDGTTCSTVGNQVFCD